MCVSAILGKRAKNWRIRDFHGTLIFLVRHLETHAREEGWFGVSLCGSVWIGVGWSEKENRVDFQSLISSACVGCCGLGDESARLRKHENT